MNPTRKRRMIFALVLLAAAGVAGTFIVLALQENLTYLHTPTDVRRRQRSDRRPLPSRRHGLRRQCSPHRGHRCTSSSP